MSEPASKKRKMTVHPAPKSGLSALRTAWPVPDIATVKVEIDSKGKAMWKVGDGRWSEWISFPVIVGCQDAPADLHPDAQPGVSAGQRLDGILFWFKSFQNNEELPPKAQNVMFPDDEAVKFGLACKDLYIAALADATVALGKVPGEGKTNKKIKNVIKDGAAAVLKCMMALAAEDDQVFINWPMKVDEKLTTPSKKVIKLSAKLNPFKPRAPGEPEPVVGPEFGAPAKRWCETHEVKVVLPRVQDLACNDMEWAEIRKNRSDGASIFWTGIIREFGISAQPPGALGINFNTTFIRSMQVASIRPPGGSGPVATDLTRFFPLEEEEE